MKQRAEREPGSDMAVHLLALWTRSSQSTLFGLLAICSGNRLA